MSGLLHPDEQGMDAPRQCLTVRELLASVSTGPPRGATGKDPVTRAAGLLGLGRHTSAFPTTAPTQALRQQHPYL